jgi:hypothetical protein
MTSNAATVQCRDGKSQCCSKLATLEQRLACIADAGPQAIEDRLVELDREWTAGRMTKASLGVVIVAGFALSFLSPWWLILPAAGGVFLLSYLFGRTSWLGKMFNEMGYRTGYEVDQEKMALKVLRGDFRHLPTVHDIENNDDIARLEGEGGIAVDPGTTAKMDPKAAAKVALEAAKS